MGNRRTNAMNEHWITTLDGRRFYLWGKQRKQNQFYPPTVATALSRMCRWAGHTQWHYSVAQHCVEVALHLPPSLRLAGLLHDAAEAYIGDISSPLKALIKSEGVWIVQRAERLIVEWLCGWHNIPVKDMERVKEVDDQAAATELRDLISTDHAWCKLPEPWDEPLHCWDRDYARDKWLELYSMYNHTIGIRPGAINP